MSLVFIQNQSRCECVTLALPTSKPLIKPSIKRGVHITERLNAESFSFVQPIGIYASQPPPQQPNTVGISIPSVLLQLCVTQGYEHRITGCFFPLAASRKGQQPDNSFSPLTHFAKDNNRITGFFQLPNFAKGNKPDNSFFFP